MAKIYTKGVWVDEVLVATPKYQVKDDVGEEVYAQAEIALAIDVVTAGTPVTADMMNNIEDGLDALDTKVDNGIIEDTSPQLGGELDLQQFSLKLPTGEPTSDVTAVGIIVTATVDTNSQGIGAPLVLAADGHYDTCNASSVNTMPCQALALETGTGTKKILLYGKIRNDAWTWTLGAGAANQIYVAGSAGALTQTKPTTVDYVVQPVGYCLTDDSIFFAPALIWLTATG